MIGFNRRFAPTTVFALERLAQVERPLIITIRANVGHIPPEVWVHDPEQGGGNIIGEVCHFVDLIQALTGCEPVSVLARAVRTESEAVIAEDNVVITLTMADGSVGTIVYTALGDKAYERERVEIFGGGAVCVIENFKTATWSQGGRRKRLGHLLNGVDRGHRAEMHALIMALRRGRPFPVPFTSYVATTRTTFAAIESLRTGRLVEVV
jgi:polar amino acid transport system substrate-binding protein